MPRKMSLSALSTGARAARGAGSRPRLAFVLQERWESNNIHARSDVIREIPVKTSSIAMVGLRPRRMI
jgi:hypothetical protein